MKRRNRARSWTAIAAMLLLLCAADVASGEAGPARGASLANDSGAGKSVRLSLKISGAKKRKRQVSFYKSVARQARIRTRGDRNPSSGR
jgi:hypothetical protein